MQETISRYIYFYLMFSLSFDLYHIYSLAFDDIINMNHTQYWDYKSSTKKTCNLYYELWGATLILSIRSHEKNHVCQTLRIMRDKTAIRGKFMINIYPANIYNRFHRKFGNRFKDFDLNPNGTIKLSKYNSRH